MSQIPRDRRLSLSAQVIDSALQVGRIPENDGRDEQV